MWPFNEVAHLQRIARTRICENERVDLKEEEEATRCKHEQRENEYVVLAKNRNHYVVEAAVGETGGKTASVGEVTRLASG